MNDAIIITPFGADVIMNKICGCERAKNWCLAECEASCDRYYDCNNVAIANDILKDFEESSDPFATCDSRSKLRKLEAVAFIEKQLDDGYLDMNINVDQDEIRLIEDAIIDYKRKHKLY